MLDEPEFVSYPVSPLKISVGISKYSALAADIPSGMG
jgi:hypothetical protein